MAVEDRLAVAERDVGLRGQDRLGLDGEDIGREHGDVGLHAGFERTTAILGELRIGTAPSVAVDGLGDRQRFLRPHHRALVGLAGDHGEQVDEGIDVGDRAVRGGRRMRALIEPGLHRIGVVRAVMAEVLHVEIAELVHEDRLRHRQDAARLHAAALVAGDEAAVFNAVAAGGEGMRRAVRGFHAE